MFNDGRTHRISGIKNSAKTKEESSILNSLKKIIAIGIAGITLFYGSQSIMDNNFKETVTEAAKQSVYIAAPNGVKALFDNTAAINSAVESMKKGEYVQTNDVINPKNTRQQHVKEIFAKKQMINF